MRNATKISILSLGLGCFFAPNSVNGQATLVSDFQFNGNYWDENSVSTCSPFQVASSSFSSGTYFWTADSTSNGGGLRVLVPDASFTEDNFSIAIEFSFSRVTGYNKILDFTLGGDDDGLYIDENLRLYGNGNWGTHDLLPNTTYSILFTRNGAQDTTYAYVLWNDTLFLESIADDPMGTFIPPNGGFGREIRFFVDDTITTGEFSPSGSVSRIRIWNGLATLGDLVVANEPPLTRSFSLFPNPAHDRLQLSFPQPPVGNLEIFDARGILVKQVEIQGKTEMSLSLADLSPGLYFVQVGAETVRFVRQ